MERRSRKLITEGIIPPASQDKPYLFLRVRQELDVKRFVNENKTDELQQNCCASKCLYLGHSLLSKLTGKIDLATQFSTVRSMDCIVPRTSGPKHIIGMLLVIKQPIIYQRAALNQHGLSKGVSFIG